MSPHNLALLAALLVSACNVVPEASYTPRFGPLDIDGTVAVSAAGTTASSSVDGLGVDEDDGVLAHRYDFGWGPADLSLTAFLAEFAGTGRTEGQLDLGPIVIPPGDPVDSMLDLRVWSFSSTWDVLPSDRFCLGLGVGVAWLDWEANIRSITTGLAIDSEESFVVPLLSARARMRSGDWSTGLVWTGIEASTSGLEASLHDFDGFVGYQFGELLGFHVDAVAGYRLILLEVDYQDRGSDVVADLELAGPYFGLTVGL